MLSNVVFQTYVTIVDDDGEYEASVEVTAEGVVIINDSFDHEFGTHFNQVVDDVEITYIFNISNDSEIMFGQLNKFDKRKLKELAKDKLLEQEEIYGEE